LSCKEIFLDHQRDRIEAGIILMIFAALL